MRAGALFPQTEFGNDPMAIRDFAQQAEELGFSHIIAADHILGVDPARIANWEGPYTYETPFHEPLILLSYMAAVTTSIEIVTSILVLTQRQTALVAKQAATLDVLSGGRLRLGVGVGWNRAEFEALDVEFGNRGKRIEEQVELLHELWKNPLVDFQGTWHTIHGAGINPLPIQRPIPIWFGGHSDPVLERAVKQGEGWLPLYRSVAEARPRVQRLKKLLEAYERSPSEFGLEFRIWHNEGPGSWRESYRSWERLGATHVHIDTRDSGLTTARDHLQAIQLFASYVGLN